MLFTSLGGSVLFILQKLTIMFSKLNELPIHLTINAPEFKLISHHKIFVSLLGSDNNCSWG